MFDTHTHLQFKVFEGRIAEVIKSANEAGVEKIIIVGTNLETSKKAIALAEKYEAVSASVGIHPHHVFGIMNYESGMMEELDKLVSNPQVVAVGETGLDRHIYLNTQYRNYQISKEFIELQKLFFKEQIKLATKHQKSLIIHNREAVPELLGILRENWDPFLEGRSVFHCCEPDQKLLEFAFAHHVFIGIDGDITYDKAKQEFIKKIPLELLVLETDSPYFLPKPLRHPREGEDPINNEPKSLPLIAEVISILTKHPIANVRNLSSENSSALYKIQ